jgi:hypothetical protein
MLMASMSSHLCLRLQKKPFSGSRFFPTPRSTSYSSACKQGASLSGRRRSAELKDLSRRSGAADLSVRSNHVSRNCMSWGFGQTNGDALSKQQLQPQCATGEWASARLARWAGRVWQCGCQPSCCFRALSVATLTSNATTHQLLNCIRAVVGSYDRAPPQGMSTSNRPRYSANTSTAGRPRKGTA